MNFIIIKIIFIPALHFMVSILLVGSGLLLVINLNQKSSGKKYIPPGNILMAISLGILFNTLEFGLVLMIYHKFSLHSQIFFAAIKYAMDLVFLTFVFLFYRKKFLDLLKEFRRVFDRKENVIILILSFILGILTILHFPHVHDSGQLIATNHMLLEGSDFLAAKRYGLGFSALFYFPAALFKGIPMGTLASGFKLFLLISTGLTAIYGMEKLATINSPVSKFLYFSIIISSYLGFYGLITLGKDSSWAILFSLIFIFSLLRKEPGENALAPYLYFLCSIAFGMIAIPYLGIFCVILTVVHFLPAKITGSKILFSALVLILLLLCFALMPARLAIDNPPHLQPVMGKHSFWHPTDGRTSFYAYFFAFKKYGCQNSTPLLMAGLLGVLLLPLSKNRFSSPVIKSTGLFIPVATLGCLILTIPAHDFFPSGRAHKIPFTPFSTFDAWNLIKDIPQWYIQIIMGIFFVLLLDEFLKKIVLPPKTARRIYLGISITAIIIILSANFSNFLALKNPAYFYSYGGNKSNNYALVLENICRNPKLERINIMKETTSLSFKDFFWDIEHYTFKKQIKMIMTIAPDMVKSLSQEMPFMLISPQESLEKLRAELPKYGRCYIYKMESLKNNNEGIYIISAKRLPPAALAYAPGAKLL